VTYEENVFQMILIAVFSLPILHFMHCFTGPALNGGTVYAFRTVTGDIPITFVFAVWSTSFTDHSAEWNFVSSEGEDVKCNPFIGQDRP
jgi:hypothetical protein